MTFENDSTVNWLEKPINLALMTRQEIDQATEQQFEWAQDELERRTILKNYLLRLKCETFEGYERRQKRLDQLNERLVEIELLASSKWHPRHLWFWGSEDQTKYIVLSSGRLLDKVEQSWQKIAWELGADWVSDQRNMGIQTITLNAVCKYLQNRLDAEGVRGKKLGGKSGGFLDGETIRREALQGFTNEFLKTGER